MSDLAAPHASRFPELSEEKAAPWANFAKWDVEHFPQFIGVEFLEVRDSYSRMRLPFSVQMTQPQGIMHGGAIATLIDTAVVPAIAAVYDERVRMVTLNLDINYLGMVLDDAAVCEAWVTKRGRSVIYCQAEVRAESTGDLVATGTLIYKVSPFK